MPITRKLAIQILEYLYDNPNYYFPFLIVCKEYDSEDDDFVEITPEERQDIEDDEIYQTFQLWENLQDIKLDTSELLAKWFIERIMFDSLKGEIRENINQLSKSLDYKLSENMKILEYWDNEFLRWKKEAFEEILEKIKLMWLYSNKL